MSLPAPALVVLLAFGLLLGCSAGSESDRSGAGEIEDLHRQALAAGHKVQAKILGDGKVTFDEYTEASQALVDCAARQGLSMQVIAQRDMRGPTVIVDPKPLPSGADGTHATQVTERCQESEQLLVDEAWQRLRPEISDEAYDLWRTCLTKAGYQGDIPRSYDRIRRDVDANIVGPCERHIYQELLRTQGP